MASLLDRVKKMIRRKPKTRRSEDMDTSKQNGGPVNPVVGPNGVVTGRPHSAHHNNDPKPQPQHTKRHSTAGHTHQKHAAHTGDGQQAPIVSTPATASGQLEIALQNDTGTSPVYAYITGQAINNNNALFLLSSDAETPYYPASPSSTGTALTRNISINLGAPGNTVYATIPQLAGGRIWFSIGVPLTFAVNPGPGLVEPSVFNESDPNINTKFGFAEFTFNAAQVFANISYVDFVGEPIALTLEDTSGATQHVSGLPSGGLHTIANGLTAQSNKDGQRWSSLIVNRSDGQLLRILSPNSGILLQPSLFSNYWTNYVTNVFARYSRSSLTIDTQASYGNVQGVVDSTGGVNFGAGSSFPRPSAADIFSCSTGPFATGSNAEANTIIPRLAAAYNRSTLLLSSNQPDGVGYKQYYQNATTNHYARIVHAANLDGHGYAFPYDDVTPDGGVPQEGAVFSYSPALLTVAVGGRNAYV